VFCFVGSRRLGVRVAARDSQSLRLLLAALAFYVRDTPECQNPNNLPQSCCLDGVYQKVGCGINADGSRRTENVGMGCCLAGAR
jgi:hypothetical protein